MQRKSIALALVASVAACGHSEDEWQAQLAKYDALAKKNAGAESDLAKARDRVKLLEAQLASMGVKLDTAGSENVKLSQALEEYKARAEALERIKARFELLKKKLEQLTKIGLDVKIRNNRMVISLPGDVLFKSGEAELADKGKEVLNKVGEVIRSDKSLLERGYQVAGHTDNQKLTRSAGEFKDNWGLSLMRAREVLVYLINPADDKKGGGGMPQNRWSAAGFGATDPIASNDNKDGRQKNRRVELILLPDVAEMLDLKSLL
jgi:chemotaxis protein MotB